VELSQAELNLTQAQIANTSAKYDYQIQHAVLSYQMGQLQKCIVQLVRYSFPCGRSDTV